MEGQASPSVPGSVFTGMKYNSSQNNTKHYYPRSISKKKSKKKPRVKSVFAGSCNLKDRYCEGKKLK